MLSHQWPRCRCSILAYHHLTQGMGDLHRLSMTSLPENLGRHVARGTARCSQNVKLLLIHYSRQSKIGNQQISVVFRSAKQQVLGFQIAMYNPMVVKVCDGG
jgi:hypothetical protein